MRTISKLLSVAFMLTAIGCGTSSQSSNSEAKETNNNPVPAENKADEVPPFNKMISFSEYSKVAKSNPDATRIYVYGATWCAACKVAKPKLDTLAAESKGFDDFTVIYVDVDSHPEIVSEAGVSSYPSIRVWDRGALVDSQTFPVIEKLRTVIKTIRAAKQSK